MTQAHLQLYIYALAPPLDAAISALPPGIVAACLPLFCPFAARTIPNLPLQSILRPGPLSPTHSAHSK